MFVLFTVGSQCEFLAKDDVVRSEWVSENVFVEIEDYTDTEMRYAWNLVENATGLEVVDFEILGNKEYGERYVEMIAYVVQCGCPEDLKYLWPKTVYPEFA